jgi:hypothetical protein
MYAHLIGLLLPDHVHHKVVHGHVIMHAQLQLNPPATCLTWVSTCLHDVCRVSPCCLPANQVASCLRLVRLL